MTRLAVALAVWSAASIPTAIVCGALLRLNHRGDLQVAAPTPGRRAEPAPVSTIAG